MDPVSHVAFGRTLMALDTHRALGRGAIAACVLGSLTPDLDAVFMPIGWDVYLRHHQGGTHSLIGSIACAALTAALVRTVATRGRYLPLVLAAWVGAVGHLVLDVISGADVRFFWPLGPPVALPLFAMADPWLGGVFVLGLVTLALRRTNSERAAAVILIAVAVLAASKAALYAKAHAGDTVFAGSVQFRRADDRMGCTDPLDHLRNTSGRRRCTPRGRLDRHDHAARQRPAGPGRSPRRTVQGAGDRAELSGGPRRHVRDRDRRGRGTPAGLVVGSSILQSRGSADRVMAAMGAGRPWERTTRLVHAVVRR